ncbi:MAG: hypothetical protein KBS56_00490 [Clostridiales bacterium]|nr:hypothetical protein [Candidatus Crickella equi]
MKQDKFFTIIGWFCGFCGVMELVIGKMIVGGALIGIGAVMLFVRGSGKSNQRSLYEKIVKTNGLTIEDVYDKIKTVNTPLGKAWLGEHEGFPGKSIIYGPTQYNDMITISMDKKKPEFNMRHINKLENVRTLDAEDDKRFDHCLNLTETKVTPKAYAEFVSFKIASVVMLNWLVGEITKMTQGSTDKVGKPGKYKVYQCNSSDRYVKDMKGNCYMRVIGEYRPFRAMVFDADDEEELMNVVPRKCDRKNQVIDSYGFDMYYEGEQYATVVRKAIDGHDAFRINTDDEEFKVISFAAVQRANVKSNYYIYRNDELKAIVAGIPNIQFEDLGQCRQQIIMSYDDDYLVLYASIVNFLMTLNNFIK